MQGQGALTGASAPLATCLFIGVIAGYFTFLAKEDVPFARDRMCESWGHLICAYNLLRRLRERDEEAV